MKKRSLTPLGETEMEVLQHVWDLKSASVADVRERILKEREVAYTTIMTVMKNLAEKGYLQYKKEGVTYIYSPAQEPENVRFNLIKDMVKKVFKGSPMQLVQTLVKGEDLTEEEKNEIRSMIEQMED
jgi:BlaI family penicillinase repressor